MSKKKKRRLKRKVKKIILFVIAELSVLVLVGVVAALLLLGNNPKDKSSDIPLSSNVVINDDNFAVNTEQNVTQDSDVPENNEILAEKAEILSQEATATAITLSWADVTNDTYAVNYKKASSDEWLTKYSENSELVITGLDPKNEYNVYITYGENEEYLPSFSINTLDSGFCDPFKSVDAVLNVYNRDASTGEIVNLLDSKTVVMSADKGCLGAEVKPIMETKLYADEKLAKSPVTVAAGTDYYVTENVDGYYCYLAGDGTWSLHVSDEEGNAGWINARTLLVDVRAVYKDSLDLFGIDINRTNAYSSVFTSGGNAQNVDSTSESDTRYNALSGKDSDYLNAEGYNVIDNVTGEKLTNYGSEDQMPLVWDMALELKTCQKTALGMGYCILIYDGYRPLSTSQLVSGELGGQGYLVYNKDGDNLAQGYLTGMTYTIAYYIAQKSRHNRGIAADLTMVPYISLEEKGEEAHMQTKMHTLDYRCNMAYNTWEADLLTEIMTKHGSNLEYLRDKQEWWHFQLVTSRTDLYPLIESYGYSDIVF